ncbi:3161_t:CDS:2, partial [Racocetra persica]
KQNEIITPVKHTIITRKVITIRHIRTLTNHQDDDGCIALNEKVAEYYGFKSVDECLQHLRKFFKTERITKLHHNVWVTACTIWYLRLVAVDHRPDWVANYEKSSSWLTKQCNGDTNLENEIMECAKNFVVQRYQVDKEAIAADNSFVAAVKTKDEAIRQEKIVEKRRMTANKNRRQISLSGTKVTQKTTTVEDVKKFITYRTKDGGFKITDELAQQLGFLNKESLEIALRSHFISNDLEKLPSDILATAVAIWYFRLLGVDHRQHWSTECDDLHKWLSLQIKNPQIERELLGSAKDFVITKYNIDDEVIGLDTPYQEHLNRDTDIESAKSIVIDNKDKAFRTKIDDAVDKNVKKSEEPKSEEPKTVPSKIKSFIGNLYDEATKLEDDIEQALGFNKDKLDDHEKAEALVIVESTSPEKCKEIVADQKDDGCIELSDTVCKELDAPKEEIIKTIKKKLTHSKLQLPDLSSSLATAINVSYLKKAASQHEGELKDKYNKAREYLKKQIGDENAVKELLECADDYVVENCIKKTIKDKKRNAVATVQKQATLEKCDDVVSKQNNDGSLELSETICKEMDVPTTKVVTEVKKGTQNKKLRSPESEPCWKTALSLSYLNIAAPHHKKRWEDKDKKARDYLSKQIGDKDAEKELLDCANKYFVDNITKKVEKDHKKDAAIAVVQESASPDKHKDIVSKQNNDGSIELDDEICKELYAPKEEIISTIQKKITNKKLKSPELKSSLATAVNISYLKNAASKYKGEWEDKYNKALDYLSKQIGDADAEKELLDCADEFVVEKTTEKVIEEKKRDVIDLKKDDIPKEEKPKAKSFFGGIYEAAVKLEDQFEKALGFDKDKLDDHEKAEALIVVEEAASPEKCKEIVADQKDDGCIELKDTVCDELDAPKEEIIKTIQKNITNPKLKLPESSLETAVNLSYLKKAAPKHEDVWKDKADKARKYLSDQIKDKDAEKELEECADNYVVDNCIKKVIKDKKRNAVITVQESATPEKCGEIISNQKDDGSFEVSETICKEIDVPATKVITEVKKCTQNPKLRSPESEPWWKTGLATSYLN